MPKRAAFAALSGTSPLQASSGKTVRHRLNRGGDRALNSAIHTIAITRIRCCPTTKNYVTRRTAEGKSSRRMVDDPGQQLGKARVVIADLSYPDRSAGWERELHFVGVAVGVDTNDGVDEFCQHGHRPSPSCREWVNRRHRLG
jgi:Transposase IS116/IS110/IS902 family